MLNRLFPCVLVVFCGIAACSGKISGTVYLDQNENGVMESEDPRLTNVLVKVFDSNNEVVGTGKTSAQGFTIPIPGSGRYCIQVDQGSLSAMSDLTLPPAAATTTGNMAKDTFGTPGFSDAGQGTSGTPTSTGNPGSTSTNNNTSSSSSSGSSSGTSTSTTQSPTSSTTTGGPSSEPTATVAPPTGSVCAQTEGLSLQLNLPVVRNYTIPLPAATKQTYSSGDSFTIHFPTPDGCTLKPVYLPDLLELAHTTKPQPIAYDVDLRQVTFLPAANQGKVLGKAAVIDVAQLTSYDLGLRVGDTVPTGDHDVTIQAKALCPGGKEINLPAINMTVKTKPLLHVDLSLTGAPVLGGKVSLLAVVDNASSQTYQDVSLVISAPGALLMTQVDASCNNLGNKASCHLALGSHGVAQRSVAVQLPVHLETSPTEFTFEAELKVEGIETPINAEPVRFSLEDGSLNGAKNN